MPQPDASRDHDGGTFKTINCVYVWIDEPGDTTVRPIRASLLEQAMAERAKIYGEKTQSLTEKEPQ